MCTCYGAQIDASHLPNHSRADFSFLAHVDDLPEPHGAGPEHRQLGAGGRGHEGGGVRVPHQEPVPQQARGRGEGRGKEQEAGLLAVQVLDGRETRFEYRSVETVQDIGLLRITRILIACMVMVLNIALMPFESKNMVTLGLPIK